MMDAAGGSHLLRDLFGFARMDMELWTRTVICTFDLFDVPIPDISYWDRLADVLFYPHVNITDPQEGHLEELWKKMREQSRQEKPCLAPNTA